MSDHQKALVFAILLGVGVFLIVAGPIVVQLFFMDRELEIIRMGIEAQKAAP